jgi:hypothetical protein
MISPGSKGWIAKYLQLVDSGEISLELPSHPGIQNDAFLHHYLTRTGIVYGHPNELLFANDLDRKKWTSDETLAVLLFEALLFVYLQHNCEKKFNEEEFLKSIELFYKKHRVQSLGAFLGYLFKESKAEKLERILHKRCDVQRHLSSTKSWLSYFNNAFIYLDILLFDDFLEHNSKNTLDYQQLALLSLAIITLSAYSDGSVEESEKALFETFLLSADLDTEERELAKLRFRNGTSLNELDAELKGGWNVKRFLLDISALTVFCNHESADDERTFLNELGDWLLLGESDVEQAIMLAQHFVLDNQNNISYLKDASSVENMMNSVSKRWIKILGRNKDKLAVELKQSKELVSLIRKSTSTELTKEEKEKVKTQFMDIAKSMPALAIFLLPGGALLLPIVLKVIPNLVPSAFRENELEE